MTRLKKILIPALLALLLLIMLAWPRTYTKYQQFADPKASVLTCAACGDTVTYQTGTYGLPMAWLSRENIVQNSTTTANIITRQNLFFDLLAWAVVAVPTGLILILERRHENTRH